MDVKLGRGNTEDQEDESSKLGSNNHCVPSQCLDAGCKTGMNNYFVPIQC